MNLKILAASFALVFIAELGDKTQLAALGFAASSRSPWAVFIGTSLALVCSSALAVLAGTAIGAHVPEKIVQIGAGVLFVLVGVFLLVNVARRAPAEGPRPEVERGGHAAAHPMIESLLARALAFEGDAAERLREAAACVQRDDLRKVLEQIADEEGVHGRRLRGITTESSSAVGEESAGVGAGSAPALPEEFELAKAARRPGKAAPETCREALDDLLRAEEAAAAFYLALARISLTPDVRRSLRSLAAQELDHVARITDVLDQLREGRPEES